MIQAPPKAKPDNECEQIDCPANQNNLCIYYRYPVWESFGIEECKISVAVMLESLRIVHSLEGFEKMVEVILKPDATS